jgi:hypothetical protein
VGVLTNMSVVFVPPSKKGASPPLEEPDNRHMQIPSSAPLDVLLTLLFIL